MSISITVDYTAFRVMATELSRVSGRDFADIIRSEAASTIKIAALYEKIASVAQIKEQVAARTASRFQGSGGLLVTQRSGRTWFSQTATAQSYQAPKIDGARSSSRSVGQRAHHGFYMIFDAGPSRGWHVPDPIWNEYLITASERPAAVRARVNEILGRRGIERNSWIQMADALGINLENVAPQGALQTDLARGARVHGTTYQNGTARENSNGALWTVTVENNSPSAIKREGQSRLDRAINQRTKGFQIAMEKGVLADLQRRAQRWPGIFVTPG